MVKHGVTVTRPEYDDLYDWSGHQLKPELRQALTAGNIARIQLQHLESGYSEAVYVQITSANETELTGIVLDTYRHFFEGEMIYVENGATLSFARACVLEIPLEWNANAGLKPLAQLTGFGRTVTGILPTSQENNG
jgi:hypothetical protein